MTGLSNFIHPALGFIALALFLPFVRENKIWRWLLPIPGIIAIMGVMSMQDGTYGPLHWLGLNMVLGRVDKLSIIFAHVFAIEALVGMIFAMHVKDKLQHIAAALYIAGGFGCVFSGDYVTLFLFWELMSVASTFIIWLARNKRSTQAGFRYFIFHTMGGLFLLGGVLLRYADLGTFAFTPVSPGAANYYDWLILLGFCVNAAVVPLHAWLPDAYPEATVTGAVFLSAFTTKTAVYVLARGFSGFEILGVMGVIMAIYGAAYATIENNARRILAYHIVSQVGYMVAGIGIGTAMTVDGACAHAYAHILYKGLLFMCAGSILYATGTAKLTKLGGLASRMPLVMICYMVAAVSISGFPLFNGFISKNITITGAALSHHTWLALGMEIAAVGTFLSVGIKLPYFAFWSKPEYTGEVKKLPRNMYVAMFMAAFLCFFTGVYPQALYRLLPFPLEYEPFAPWQVLSSLQLLGFTGLGFYICRKIIVPHEGRNLDFDIVYRFVGWVGLFLAKYPVALIDDWWTSVYRRIGLAGLLRMAKGSSIFDAQGIDGVVDGTAKSVLGLGGILAKVQTGKLSDYVGLSALIGIGIIALVYFMR
ncbi:MAG: Na(+)/H(+) antiporter subunit D [Desulfoplanes sp.]